MGDNDSQNLGLAEVLAPHRCATLVIDLQNDMVRPEGVVGRAGNDVTAIAAIVPRCADFIEASRAYGVPVVHVQTTTLRDGASDSPSWLRAKGSIVNTGGFCLEGSWGAQICEEVAPAEGEVVITKHRSSAFHQTNLDLVLRSMGVETVVVIGEQTPGCVEATFRDAAYHDFYNVLLEDCVAAYDEEQHEASLLVQRRRHDVCTADDVLAIWKAAARA